MKKELAGSGVRMSSFAPTVLKSLLEDTAQFDRNGADIDRKAFDLLGRCTSANAAFVIHHNGVQSGMGESRGGTKPACTGAK